MSVSGLTLNKDIYAAISSPNMAGYKENANAESNKTHLNSSVNENNTDSLFKYVEDRYSYENIGEMLKDIHNVDANSLQNMMERSEEIRPEDLGKPKGISNTINTNKGTNLTFAEEITNHEDGTISVFSRAENTTTTYNLDDKSSVTVRNCPTNAKEDYRFFLQNEQNTEFSTSTLGYAHDDEISISGFFQRFDNFLEKEFDNRLTQAKNLHTREKAELPSAEQALEKPFAQADDLKLVRENHSAVMKELKLMQEVQGYVSKWKPKTLQEFRAEKILEERRVEIVETIKVEKNSTVEISL